MNISDLIRSAINAELDKRKAEIDGDRNLANVSLVINVDTRNEEVGDIIWRKESRTRPIGGRRR